MSAFHKLITKALFLAWWPYIWLFFCVFFFYSSCWVPSSPPDNNNFLSSPLRNARVQTQWSQPAMLTRGIVMTTGTNDTPLNEPPGADNMPNRWRDLCREPIPPAIWCHVIVSADQRLIATLKLCAALIGTFFFVFCFLFSLTCLAASMPVPVSVADILRPHCTKI